MFFMMRLVRSVKNHSTYESPARSLGLNVSVRTVKYIFTEVIIFALDWVRKVANISPFSSFLSVLKSII